MQESRTNIPEWQTGTFVECTGADCKLCIHDTRVKIDNQDGHRLLRCIKCGKEYRKGRFEEHTCKPQETETETAQQEGQTTVEPREEQIQENQKVGQNSQTLDQSYTRMIKAHENLYEHAMNCADIMREDQRAMRQRRFAEKIDELEKELDQERRQMDGYVEQNRKFCENVEMVSKTDMEHKHNVRVFEDCEEQPIDKMTSYFGLEGVQALSCEVLKRVKDSMNTAFALTDFAGLKPNNKQMALALAITCRLVNYTRPPQTSHYKKTSKVLAIVPAGCGKTRIAFATVGSLTKIVKLLRSPYDIDRVIVVYPNDILLDQDHEAWESAKDSLAVHETQITAVVGMKNASKFSTENSLIIVDEADDVVIDQQSPIPECKFCVGFTATLPQASAGTFIKGRFETLGFEVIDNFYSRRDLSVDQYVKDYPEFFLDSKRPSKLVYCPPEDYDIIRDLAKKHHLEPIKDCKSIDKRRNMDGKCMVVTEPKLMRGVDYRRGANSSGEQDGIDLFIARPLNGERAHHQALARVGRYGEPCKRYQKTGLEAINRAYDRQLEVYLCKTPSLKRR